MVLQSHLSMLVSAILQTHYLFAIQLFLNSYFGIFFTGIGKKEHDRDAVKLHMTVMNVKYIKLKTKHSKSFDATEILERYGSFDFGHQAVDQIYLAEMKRKDADGFYMCL